MNDFDDERDEVRAADDWNDEPVAPAKRRRAPVDEDWDDDWDDDDEDRPTGRRDLTVVYAVAAAAVVIIIAIVLTRPSNEDQPTAQQQGGAVAPTATEAAPIELQWQGPVGEAADRVEARIASETGVFVWTDFFGWHVRSNLDREVQVKVVVDDAAVRKDADDQPVGDPAPEFTGTIPVGDAEGIDLDLQFSNNATFEITVDGQLLPADQIKLGGVGQAMANPVVLAKA